LTRALFLALRDPKPWYTAAMKHVLGVLGGSGLYELEGLLDIQRFSVKTPYGPPSDDLIGGRLGETQLIFLPRHGRGHRIAPHAINYRANIWALRELGVTHLVSLSAVGSMRESIEPGHVVVVDQFIDRTWGRASTFFEDGVVAHVSMADPVCADLAAAAARAAVRAGAPRVHPAGTYVCINGPQFSTRAESHLYRAEGVDVIGMTALPEAKLAREAALPYALVAFATDYDCWHQSTEPVTVEMVLEVVRKNTDLAKSILRELAQSLPPPRLKERADEVLCAIMTSRTAAPGPTLDRLTRFLAREES